MSYTFKLILIFISFPFLLQGNLGSDKLLQRVAENSKLFKIDPEEAFIEADRIEKEAVKTKNREVELKAIQIKYNYYKKKNDFEDMLATAKYLDKKAKSYNLPIYQVSAKVFLFESYTFSGLPDRGFKELNSALNVVDKIKGNDIESIKSRAVLYTSFSNYYSSNDDKSNELKYLRLSGREFEKLPDSDYKNQLLYIHYSNMGMFFTKQDEPDSTKTYVSRSEFMDKGFNRNDIKFNNLLIHGSISLKEKKYEEALAYFKKAEKLVADKNHFNLNFLYDGMIQAYQAIDQREAADIYQAKKDSLNLGITQSKNKTLLNLLGEKTDEHKMYYYLIIIIGMGTGLILFYFLYKKKKSQANLNEEAQKTTSKSIETINEEHYSKLIEMLKNNDLAFMAFFDEVYPDFSSNILKKHPETIQSEMEFYALLKLKLSTSDISRYKNIEPKTVRNKKYLTKKKLGIPKEVDIYQWFSQF